MFTSARLALLVCLAILLCSAPCIADDEDATTSPYGTITGQVRTYYFTQRNKTTGQTFDSVKESLAVGGYLKYETPWLADHFGAGLAGYFSEPFIDAFNENDKGGTGLLSKRNQGIQALGEAYLKGRYAQSEARVYRQRIDTPFINSNDSRMLAQTFEAYGIKSKDVNNLELSLFWVDKEKARDTELFKSMGEMAGLTGTNTGVVMTGADWQATDTMPLRFWNYYTPNLDNTFFTEAKYLFGDPADLACELTFQGVDQRSVGDQRDGTYNAAEAGLQSVFKVDGFDFYLGATIVDGARGIRNSWGNYPFFNNMMGYDFSRSGEHSGLLGVGYDFSRIGVDGFKANLKAVFGDTPDTGVHATYDRSEYNLNMDYAFGGALKGLSILNRWSYQDADESMGGRDGYQVRLRLQYDFRLL
jgi:hypothetical protein